MNSYNIINYRIRPQKQVERGLIAHLINDFSHSINKPIDYIGMGSLYFTDFLYFNKNCNLNKMYSIEYMEDENGNYDHMKERRFLNNKPLSEIQLIPLKTSEAIPQIPIDSNSFIWLDYDGQFRTCVIDDLEILINKLFSTTPINDTLITISFNSGSPKEYKCKDGFNIELCNKDYEQYKLTNDMYNEFTVENYSSTAIDICEKYIIDKIESNNKICSSNVIFKKLSTIKYKDGANMNTIIWSFIDYNNENAQKIQNVLESSEISKELINLNMIDLTLYEKQQIDRCEVDNLEEFLTEKGLKLDDVSKYKRFAKYIPEYTEIFI